MAKLNRKIIPFLILFIFFSPQRTNSLEQTGLMYLDKSVVFIIDPYIETGIRDSLNQFTADLNVDGYNVIKHSLMESTPEDLRSFLQWTYQNSSPQLVGAVLIGNIPKPYFRFYYPASNGCLERGPTECISFQFYQDLDGIFSRTSPASCDHPGCYDTHSGSIDSEIWISVLPFNNDVATTINRINCYFTKNHEFRIGLRRSGPGYIEPLIGSQIDTPEIYQWQVDEVLNSAGSWKPLTHRGNVLVGPDNSLGDQINYPNAAYCYEQAMLTNKYDFANIGAHGSCTGFGMTGGSIYIDVDWANTHNIKPHFLWDDSCNTGNIDCQPNLASAFLYNPDNYVVLVKGATSPQGGLGKSVFGYYRPTIGGRLSQGWSFGEAILDHINNLFVDCYAQQREYFVAQSILLGDGTLKLPEFLPIKVRDDLIGTWSGQGVYYRNSDSCNWVKLGSPAAMITAGDTDDDGIDDLLGTWPAQGGVWVKYSSSDSWARLSSTADWIATGDMNGDGRDDLLGTWTGQGVYYRNSTNGQWMKMATPATQITSGDLDNDGTDDLVGIWPAQGGVWVKYSSSGKWARLSSTADWIGAGDMNGDGRDDLLGTWTGQGVYYRDAANGQWVKMATPATQIAAGDLDGDGTDDLVGIWPGQGGVWVKYSSDSTWERLSSTADWIAAGKMRAPSSSSTEIALSVPIGGIVTGPSLLQEHEDLSSYGPWGLKFKYIEEKNIRVGSEIDEEKQNQIQSGPGDPGFRCIEQKNLVPKENRRERER